MTKRPYISKKLPELELIVANTSDSSVLIAIRSELGSRKKKRARELEETIDNKLSITKQTTTPAPSGNFTVVDQKAKSKPTVRPRIRVKEKVAVSEERCNVVNKQMTTNKKIKYSEKKTMVSYPKGFLSKNFEDMRKKLLDISGGRSRLLNLKQDTKGFVRVVDELPNQLASELLAGKNFTMDAVDDPKERELIKHGYLVRDDEDKKWIAAKAMPTAREWAKIKGIKIEYELPLDSFHADDKRHQDNNVQTVLFSSALTSNLKKLSNQAKTSIEETGNNILFLSLGFLEWTDKIGGNSRLAPLYMIPVVIDKYVSRSITRYQIKFTGEDIIGNLTLREKLSRDFEVELPAISDNSEEDKLYTPEEYFSEVEALLALKAGDASMADWKVRRFATLATLNLGRLLMYRDLDPARWPEGDGNLLEHDFIRKFFSEDQQVNTPSAGSGGGSGGGSEVYILDDVQSLHEKFPMVEDADSSQMSALIDILNGQSMVIEGPPGTGKSQTITNLIAAAISQGKSILFVAEKQAALDVVKRRMDKAGLGDFCLDLHSDKAQKRMVLDSFSQRIQLGKQHYFETSDYDVQVQRYERSRKQLQDYCLMVNKPWKNTGFTIHEILCAATRYAKDVAPLEYNSIAPEGISGENFTRIKLDEQLEQLELFFKYLGIVSLQLPEEGNWQSHPWHGVNNKKITGMDESVLLSQLNDWTSQLISVNEQLSDLFTRYDVVYEQELVLPEVEQWITELNSINPLTGNESLIAFKRISPNQIESLRKFITLSHEAIKGLNELGAVFNQALLSDLDQLEAIKASIHNVEDLGVAINIQFDELARSIRRVEESIELIQSVEHKRSEVVQHLPMAHKAELENLFSVTQMGFTELGSFVGHAMALPAELLDYRDDTYDNESLPMVFSEFKRQQDKLLTEKGVLSFIFKLDRLPDVSDLQGYADVMSNTGFFSFFNSTWRQAKKEILSFTTQNKLDKKSISTSLEDLVSWKRGCIALLDSHKYKAALGRDFDGIDSNSERIEKLMLWYQSVRKDYGIGFGERTVIANVLFSLNKDIFRGIQQLHSGGINTQISELQGNLTELSGVFTNIGCINDIDCNLAPEADPLQQALLDIRQSLEGIQKYLINPNMDQKELLVSLAYLETIRENIAQLEHVKLSDTFFDGQLDLSLGSKGTVPKDLRIVESTVSYLADIYNSVTNQELITLLTERVSTSVISDLLLRAENLQGSLDLSSRYENLILESIESDREQWTKGSGSSILEICTRNNLAVDNIEWLDSWTKYLHAKDRMQEGGQGRLKDYLADSQFTLDYGKQVMNFASYTCLANEVYQQQTELSSRSGHEQTAIQEQFKRYDDELKSLQRKRVAQLALEREVDTGTSGAKVSSYTGGHLLHYEIAKKKRHIAIRKLVDRAGDAMLGYKPCFMMSPMAVAKYLPPGKLQFDLVIMDEASQVKPEYALSCFARGKQAVVVGDPKQLPPTTFFDRSTSNDDSVDDDERGVLNDSESILEAIGAHYPKRTLQWHYRSRHESLIDFSNRYFYDSELVIFPSPWAQSDEFGVKFTHVTNGVFISGVNNEEAKSIVEAIKNHFIYHIDESLGVVAMNSKQREQIEAVLEATRSHDAELDAALKHDSKTLDPLFIKNLENVQGDERDVIIISFTYGPNSRGSNSVPQRFGPINNEQGWRRLNVLFTRAKKRIQVYSSMRSEHIVVSESSKRGVRALKNYLAYAESGELIEQSGDSQGEPDSDFEIAVMKQLANAGYECVPQVGVAGFKIDVGVRDPGMPGRYLMGIECDGATYHSSKSTRDRDRVRQGVLEGLTWNIKRVWSTDWFKNPDAEMKPIIDELNRLSTPVIDIADDEVASPIDIDVTLEDSEVIHNVVMTPDIEEELIRDEAATTTSLKSRLQDFNDHIIEREFPDTPPTKRLLRNEMLEMLDSQRPIDLDDFSELIPNYLRTHTSTKEAAMFLGDVLEIIAVFEELHSEVE